MSRVDILRGELEDVGPTEFCRRRYSQTDIPYRLLERLAQTPVVNPGDIEKLARSQVTTLTPKRLRTLEMMAAGYHNKEIAAELGCSFCAAVNVVQTVLLYFGARNKAHAVHLAHQRGILS